MSPRSHLVPGSRLVVELAIQALALAALAIAGCSFPPSTSPTAISTADTPHEITVVVRVLTRQVDARTDSQARYISTGVLGLVTALAGGSPIGVMLVYGATHIGLAAVEQGRQGEGKTIELIIPHLPGQPTSTLISPDGTVSVTTRRAHTDALDPDKQPPPPTPQP